MKITRLIYILAAIITFLVVIPAFAQEEKAATPAANVPEPLSPNPMLQPEELSIYGEVKSVDSAAGAITVEYYDYDTDGEKTMDLAVDKDTKMENSASLTDIKKGSWVDVIYTSKDGKNTAKSVIVEKEEELAPEEAAPVSPE